MVPAACQGRPAQSRTWPEQTSPVAGLVALALMMSVPAWSVVRRLTVNEPLGASVVRRPEKTVVVLSARRTAQVWPTLLLSTANSIWIVPSSRSGLAFSFQVDVAVHEPQFPTAVVPPLAWAGAMVAIVDRAAQAVAARMRERGVFMRFSRGGARTGSGRCERCGETPPCRVADASVRRAYNRDGVHVLGRL